MAQFQQNMQDCYDENSGSRIGYRVGKYNNTNLNGALRFTGISILKNATISSATLSLVVGSRGGSNTDIKFETYGIDEDNTADFSNNPMGRNQTTAVATVQANIDNSRFDVNVKSIVEEITTRGSWSSGNAMGFIVRNYQSFTPNNVYWEDYINTGNDSYLTINYVVASTSPSSSTSPSISPSHSLSPSTSPSYSPSSSPSPSPGTRQSIRIALPGYNAETDRNLDHFALFSDEDNILIKEHSRGSFTTSNENTTITHNLGYVPFFLAYVYDDVGAYGPINTWQQIGDANLSIAYAAIVDTTTLVISNLTAASKKFIYYIFYDNVVGSSTNTITESQKVFKVAKNGINAFTSKNPNDYIYHSDLNTFKIIKEGTSSISYTGDNTYSFNHGASITDAAAFMMFVKFPDESITIVNGTFGGTSRDYTFGLLAGITSTQIKCKIFGDGVNRTLTVKYYIFETPLT